MLISLSTLLSRAKRRKQPVIAPVVRDIEVAEAVLQAAEAERQSILFVLADDPAGVIPLSFLFSYVRQRAAHLETEISLQLRVPMQESAVKQALALGADSLSLEIHAEDAKITTVRFTAWAAAEAGRERAGMIGNLPDVTTLTKTEAFVRQTGVAALTVPVLMRHGQRSSVSPVFLRDLAAAVRIPVLASDLEAAPRWIKPALKAGVAGFYLDVSLDEAFTAGVRTALRNRSLHRPGTYLTTGVLAVRESVKQYIRLSK
ncbi:class II fructose-bisphosphate aldolase [Patescibacteria group bacterium]|nr:class II fructose-bisphosphate aldolase [Patescibacteria group bacterium]